MNERALEVKDPRPLPPAPPPPGGRKVSPKNCVTTENGALPFSEKRRIGEEPYPFPKNGRRIGKRGSLPASSIKNVPAVPV